MASATEEAMPVTMPEPAPAALGSPSSIPVDGALVEQIDLLKAGQDTLQQKVADKFEELEKEGQILRAIVNDIKENVKMSLKNIKDERENLKDEAEKGAKESIQQGERAEAIMKASQKAQEDCTKEFGEMAAIATNAAKESQKNAYEEVEKFINKFTKFEQKTEDTLEKLSKMQRKSPKSVKRDEKGKKSQRKVMKR